MSEDTDSINLAAIKASLEVIESNSGDLHETKITLQRIEEHLSELLDLLKERSNPPLVETAYQPLRQESEDNPRRTQRESYAVGQAIPLVVVVSLLAIGTLVWHFHSAGSRNRIAVTTMNVPSLAQESLVTNSLPVPAVLSQQAPQAASDAIPVQPVAPNPLPSSPWTMTSDGHTWNSASDEDKRQLCAAISRHDPSGNSESFYFDAFNFFYRSDDAKILNTNINDMIPLIDSGSTALPASDKQY